MPKTLLLADDSVTIQKVVGITFANEDVELVTVDNGDDALVRAREVQPDIVLADVSMPGLNGYALCAEIKRDPALQRIPVLLLTGTFEPFDETRAIEVGADAHISKPFEAQALVDRVRTLLERGPELLPAAPQATPPSPEILPPSPEPSPVLEPTSEPLRPAVEIETPAPAPPSPFADSAFGDRALEAPIATPQPASPEAEPELIPGLEFGPPATGLEPEGLEETRIFSREMLPAEEEPPALAREPALESFESPQQSFEQPQESMDFSSDVPALRTPRDSAGDPAAEAAFERALDSETSFLDPTHRTGASGADTASTPLLGEELADPRQTWDAPEEELFEGDREPDLMSDASFTESPPSAPTLDPPGEPLSPGPLEMTMEMPSANEPTEPELEPLPEPIDDAPDALSEDLDDALSPADEELPWLEPVPVGAPDSSEETAPDLAKATPVDAEQLRESLERVAWEAFGPLSEQLVREVVKKVEEIAWEVVPQLTEQLIREEISRLKGESD
jgi:CheY-like chemotaxis protein